VVQAMQQHKQIVGSVVFTIT